MSTEWRSARIAMLIAKLERHRDNIARLEERKAKYGLNVPLELENELVDEQVMAMKVEAQLQHLGAGGEDPLDRLFREATRTRITGQVGRALQLYEQIQREDPTYPDIAVHVTRTRQELARGYIDNGGRVIPERLMKPITAGALTLLCIVSALVGIYLISPNHATPVAVATPSRTSEISGATVVAPTSTASPTSPPGVLTHTPTLTTPPGTPGAPVYHYVRYGETLSSIARLYGVNPYAIARANGLANPNRIHAGQRLIIPQGGGTTPPPDMVYVPAGEFTMASPQGEGDDDEHLQHTVYLDAFYIDKYEVTNAQFAQFLNQQGNQEESGATWLDIGDEDCLIRQSGGQYQPRSGYSDHPVIEVSWYGARAYCQWVSKRLPTEAEWEKAARGTDEWTYPWGEGIDCDHAQYRECGGRTVPVGSKPRGGSPYGALDMAGNVWEWVADWYDSGYYAVSPENNPKGPASGVGRVLRGGSWDASGAGVRAANRDWGRPDGSNFNVGFRCVR